MVKSIISSSYQESDWDQEGLQTYQCKKILKYAKITSEITLIVVPNNELMDESSKHQNTKENIFYTLTLFTCYPLFTATHKIMITNKIQTNITHIRQQVKQDQPNNDEFNASSQFLPLTPGALPRLSWVTMTLLLNLGMLLIRRNHKCLLGFCICEPKKHISIKYKPIKLKQKV